MVRPEAGRLAFFGTHLPRMALYTRVVWVVWYCDRVSLCDARYCHTAYAATLSLPDVWYGLSVSGMPLLDASAFASTANPGTLSSYTRAMPSPVLA
eukprot:2320647-Rhodomonas_salina.5